MSELLTVSLGDLYAPVYNNLYTRLSTSISDSDSTINVLSTSNFPTSGVISIGTEVIMYTGKTSYTFTGCQRGFDNTTASGYASNSLVELRWVAAHHNSISNEIVKIEGVLGKTISIGNDAILGNVSYANLDARISSFEDYNGIITPPPVTGRFGAKYRNAVNDDWYIFNGSSWNLISSSTLTPSSDDWDFISISGNTYGLGVTMVTPKLAPFVNSAYGAMFMTGTLSNQLNSISGFGVIGREGNNLSYKTPSDSMVQIVSGDRLVVPYIMSFTIDSPILNEISIMAVVPDGNRNIRKAYVTSVGDSGYVEVSLNKISSGNTYNDAYVITTVGISLVNSITPVMTSITLGGWDDSSYSISAGDLIYSRITSVSGSPGMVTMTIEAPYYVS